MGEDGRGGRAGIVVSLLQFDHRLDAYEVAIDFVALTNDGVKTFASRSRKSW